MVRSAQGRYHPRTAPRLLTAERQVTSRQAGVTTLCTAFAVEGQARASPSGSSFQAEALETDGFRRFGMVVQPPLVRLSQQAGKSCLRLSPTRGIGLPRSFGCRPSRSLVGAEFLHCDEPQRAPCCSGLSGPTTLRSHAWEAAVLPLNYTRTTSSLAEPATATLAPSPLANR